MPFDDALARTALAPSEHKAEISLIEKLEILFADPKNWCRGKYSERQQTRRWWFGRWQTHESFCLIGGLAHVTRRDPDEVHSGEGPRAVRNVRNRLQKLAGESIPDFNDSHDHDDILELLARTKASFTEEFQ